MWLKKADWFQLNNIKTDTNSIYLKWTKMEYIRLEINFSGNKGVANGPGVNRWYYCVRINFMIKTSRRHKHSPSIDLDGQSIVILRGKSNL